MSLTSIPVERLATLMPMHLLFDMSGDIRSCGPTLRKLIGRATNIATPFELRRAPPDAQLLASLGQAAQTGRRVFLGLRGDAFRVTVETLIQLHRAGGGTFQALLRQTGRQLLRRATDAFQ